MVTRLRKSSGYASSITSRFCRDRRIGILDNGIIIVIRLFFLMPRALHRPNKRYEENHIDIILNYCAISREQCQAP